MGLGTGTRLGPYEIVSTLGSGAMGAVYRARDTRLGREVAIKVLPEEFTGDPERLARFEREAKVLASLNHPKIASMHGMEESGGAQALVMELVEGQMLSERIAEGPLPPSETLAIARQIAEALEYAHERGIIHRDLKPANVKVTPEGQVKVLDFGLAKAFEAPSPAQDVSSSPTLTVGSESGRILGTAAYMAPEQARGKAVDKRADIWAFGAVLFEMLSGKLAFPGETITDVLSAVISREPDWSALPAGSPTRLLRRCLEKDPRRRLRDIGDAFQDADAVEPSAAVAQPVWRQPVLWVLLLITLVTAGLAGWLGMRSSGTVKQVSRLVIPLAAGQEVTGPPAISSDGGLLAYTAKQGTEEPRLYLRSLNSFDARVVSGSEGAQLPFLSPDAKWVAFFAHGQLLKAAVEGGSLTPVAPAASSTILGGTWSEDDSIIFTPGMGSGLMRVSASGGPVEALTHPDGGAQGYAHVWPRALPGGHSILFTVWGKSVFGNAILALDTRRWEMVLPGTGGAVFSPSGHILVGNENAEVRAANLDSRHPAVTTAEAQVLSDVDNSEDLEGVWMAVARNGTAAYVPGNPARRSLVWVDREGRATPVSQEQTRYAELALAPDGSKAIVKQGYDLWVYDFQRGTHTRLTLHGSTREDSSSPEWSRDSRRVFFCVNRDGNWDIYAQPADGSQPAELVLKRPYDKFPTSTAPDGTLMFSEANPTTGEDLWLLSPAGKVSPWRVSQFNESNGVFSPDGRWVAYDSDESGRSEIYMQSYPGGQRRFLVSTSGGFLPRWSSGGKELFYVAGDSFMAVPVHPDGSTGTPHRLFDRTPFLLAFNVYAPSPDGKRFLMIRRDPGSVPRQINLILNWPEELKRLSPVKGQ